MVKREWSRDGGLERLSGTSTEIKDARHTGARFWGASFMWRSATAYLLLGLASLPSVYLTPINNCHMNSRHHIEIIKQWMRSDLIILLIYGYVYKAGQMRQ
jgi:hypothetical protein